MSDSSGYGLGSLSGTVNLNLAKSQARLQAEVSHLSSGLRIESAPDDPSGLAIAEGLQSKVNGYDQASSNVQTANNMLTVADGALQTVTDILQRLRMLAVQANDDLLSADDRSNIQTECTQLQAEINSIAESTNFNGVPLLNRSLDATPDPSVTDSTFAHPTVGYGGEWAPPGSPWTWSAFTGFSGAGVFDLPYLEATNQGQPPPSGATQVADLTGGAGLTPATGAPSFSQTITGFKANESYTISFSAAQNAQDALLGISQSFSVLLDGNQIASYQPIPADPSDAAWTSLVTPAFTGGGSHTISFQGTGNGNIFIDDVQLNIVSAPRIEGPGVQVHDGADEGNALNVQLPTVFTSTLGISSENVADSSSAATFEAHIDLALDAVNGSRAALGAQMVRLQYQGENDDTAAINLTGSESAIRDANIAQTTTAFAADQILSTIGTSILGNVKTLAASVEKLFQ